MECVQARVHASATSTLDGGMAAFHEGSMRGRTNEDAAEIGCRYGIGEVNFLFEPHVVQWLVYSPFQDS